MSNHLSKSQEIHRNWMARVCGNATATAQLLALGLDAAALDELVRMNEAAWSRLRALREGWMRDWAGWLAYASQLKGANTMSKLVEREGNIFGQAAQIMSAQATALAGLQENTEIDYSYWLREKLAEKQHLKAKA